jgi:hypothetical protein
MSAEQQPATLEFDNGNAAAFGLSTTHVAAGMRGGHPEAFNALIAFPVLAPSKNWHWQKNTSRIGRLVVQRRGGATLDYVRSAVSDDSGYL